MGLIYHLETHLLPKLGTVSRDRCGEIYRLFSDYLTF